MGLEEEEGGEGAVVLLLEAAVALMLRVTPTGLQIVWAKAMTSVEREGVLVSMIVFLVMGRGFMLAFVLERVLAPVWFCVFWFVFFSFSLFLSKRLWISRCWRRTKKCCTEKREGRREEKGSENRYTFVKSPCGHCFSAPASALLMNDLSLHRHLKSLD